MRPRLLINTYPEIAKEWHPTLNTVPVETVRVASKLTAWWRCTYDPTHEWQQPVYLRASRYTTGCKACKWRYNSLAANFPKVAKEWHPTLNGDLTADCVSPRSPKYIWWQCDVDNTHIWKAAISNRTHKLPTGCPFCANRLVNETNSLAACKPNLAKDWHEKNSRTPDNVSYKSNLLVWWRCQYNSEHEWQYKVSERARTDAECPYCRFERTNRRNCLAKRAPEVAREWYRQKNSGVVYIRQGNAKNTFCKLNATTVSIYDNNLAWWKCKAAGHVWEARIANRALYGEGCPYCTGKMTFEKNSDFLSTYPHLVKSWHPNLNLPFKPSEVQPMSNHIVWWQCKVSSAHVWAEMISQLIKKYLNRKTICPYCSGELQTKYKATTKKAIVKKEEKERKKTEVSLDKKSNRLDLDRGKRNQRVQIIGESARKSKISDITDQPLHSEARDLSARLPLLIVNFWHPTKNTSVHPGKEDLKSTAMAWWECPNGHTWCEIIYFVAERYVRKLPVCPDCQKKPK